MLSGFPAIITRYYSDSMGRGRIRATGPTGKVTVRYDHALPSESDRHRVAVEAYIAQSDNLSRLMDTGAAIVHGWMPDGNGYVWTFVLP